MTAQRRGTQARALLLINRSRWPESITRLGGFRALKKTTEAPYSTKVNYRIRTTRGTTPSGVT